MCPWARHRNPLAAQAVGSGSRAWPLTSLWRVADKKRFSRWGFIKYHIIIWMQLIVSLSVFISALGRNAWYDLVTVGLLYLSGEKVCRPKCQMIKEQSSALYASYLSGRLSAFKPQFITMSHLRSSLLRLLYHVCCVGKTYISDCQVHILFCLWFSCRYSNVSGEKTTQNVTGKSFTSLCALNAALLRKTKRRLKQS